MPLETHRSFHSALFSLVPGRLATPLRCAAEAILGNTVSVNAPLHPRVTSIGDPQEPPQNLLLAGSLSSFLSLVSGLVAYIHGLPLGSGYPDWRPSGQ